VVLDTSEVIERIKRRKTITENITIVSLIEYPKISGHPLFKGKVYLPTIEDYVLAFNIQKELYRRGKPKSFSDLVITAICINRKEKLITKDKNFKDIKEVTNIDVEVLE
ncbi:MAG: DNA-binding protein, partial [Candidatus Baldrarchaeia archaeon]